jgi:hypothetical protein
MVRPYILLLLMSALATPIAVAEQATTAAADGGNARVSTEVAGASSPSPIQASPSSAPWPVETSLKNTLRVWARRQGWPAPQFLTEADWAVDVPGSIPGSIEDALIALAEGFGTAPMQPRIELTANHVMLVSEVGAE